jgi:CRISPR-associated DxTHG motif protein
MKVLSFLGTGNYSPTLYTHDGRACTTSFFPVAACELLAPQDLILALTKGARERWWTELSTELAQRYPGIRLSEVAIPDGGTQEEIWGIFDILVGQFSPGDEVIIDITHGFRSLPALALIAAVYLRAARGVRVQRLVYGAYEARGDDKRTPVFDLTPFLDLLDWAAAADLLRRTGNAEPLGDLLRSTKDRLIQSGVAAPQLASRLSDAGGALAGMSRAMRLARVHESMTNAADLMQKLDLAEDASVLWAKPFAALLNKARETYRPFAQAPQDADTLAGLGTQLEMIQWLADRGWAVEAVTLTREWIVSREVLRSGLPLVDESARKVVEDALNGAVRAKQGKADGVSPEPRTVAALDPLPSSVAAWSAFADLRNDVAHSGMRPPQKNRRSAKRIVEEVAKLHGRLLPLLEEVGEQQEGDGRCARS